jgi:hypothetical protein
VIGVKCWILFRFCHVAHRIAFLLLLKYRNGGKEVVDDYLERTREDVVDAEKQLRAILGYLNLEPLPPIKGKL